MPGAASRSVTAPAKPSPSSSGAEEPTICGHSDARQLQPLEAAHALPICYCGVECRELDTRVVEVVIDHICAERVARKRAGGEQVARVAQRVGHVGTVG